MASISKEDFDQLMEQNKIISVGQLNVDNAMLVLELEKSRFEVFKLKLFRKYNLSDDNFIDKDGEIKTIEAEEKILEEEKQA